MTDYREPCPSRGSVAPRGTQTAAPPAYPDNHYTDRATSPLLPQALAGAVPTTVESKVR